MDGAIEDSERRFNQQAIKNDQKMSKNAIFGLGNSYSMVFKASFSIFQGIIDIKGTRRHRGKVMEGQSPTVTHSQWFWTTMLETKRKKNIPTIC